MQIRRTSSSNIIDFPDLDYGNKEIDAFLQKISEELGADCLPDWTLIVRFIFGLGDWVGVVKRGIPYPSTKEKDISITIPVPTTESAPYGLSKKRFLHRPPLHAENFYVVPIDWNNYDTLRDCLHDCAMRGVLEAFKRGVTVGGKRVFYP